MQSFNPEFQNLQHSFSEMNHNMELLNHLSASENLLNSDLSNGSFLDHQQPPLPLTYTHNIQSSFLSHGPFCDPVTRFLPSAGGPSREGKSVKGISETDTFQISSPPPSGSGLVADKKTKRNYSFGGKKRKRSNEREVEKPREVIHVRAKRGQATDSHSLAERLRREKINEKLRCLQDLVPGCYKTMGMAVMLDVIISYVRSLQNQIDFLSMKLSAASLFYDFNSEVDATETMQGTNGYEAQGTDRMEGEGFGGGFSYFPSTWPF